MPYVVFCEKCKLGSFVNEHIEHYVCNNCRVMLEFDLDELKMKWDKIFKISLDSKEESSSCELS